MPGRTVDSGSSLAARRRKYVRLMSKANADYEGALAEAKAEFEAATLEAKAEFDRITKPAAAAYDKAIKEPAAKLKARIAELEADVITAHQRASVEAGLAPAVPDVENAPSKVGE